MSRRRSYYDYGRYSQTRGPHVLPYLIIAILALLVWLYLHFVQQPVVVTVSGQVLDAYTSQPIPGAVIEVRDAGGMGSPMAAAPDTSASGVIVPSANITIAGAQTATLPLQPSPVPVMTTTTGADGNFVLQKLPQGAWLHVAPPGYSAQDVQIGDKTALQVRLVPDNLRGKVLTADQQPILNAYVYSSGASTQTDGDGSFVLNNVTDRTLIVKAPGYQAAKVAIGAVTQQNVVLKPFTAKAVYMSADTASSPQKLFDMIQMIDKTELNAVVMDVKADTTGYVLYDSKLPEVQAMGALNPQIADLKGLVDTLHQHNIYVIARLSLFWDERLAGARPDLAIRSKSGGVWSDASGHHWANPRLPEVWAYNLAIAHEVAARGVDEIQFDYVRFPSDGNLEDADYGKTDGSTRAQVIQAFLQRAYSELSPSGVYVSADVFGLSPIVNDDLGIGQQWEDVGSSVDYVSPMAYPSHYADGFMGFDKPAEHPGEVVSYTLEQGEPKLLGRRAEIRPWLQDFTLYGITYDVTRVRGQIEAAEKLNTAGWMLWNYDNDYTQAALKPQ